VTVDFRKALESSKAQCHKITALLYRRCKDHTLSLSKIWVGRYSPFCQLSPLIRNFV